MDRQRLLARTAKAIANLLGREPDCLGLIPDEQGFVGIKALLVALSEDQELRRVRRTELHEICLSLPEPPLEIAGERIRALRRDLPAPRPLPAAAPKLLYAAIRPRAHAAVLAEGLRPTVHPQVILADSPELALRWGRRLAPKPVLVTVRVQAALDQAVRIERLGTMLYLADTLPPTCLSLPPLPAQPPPEAPSAPKALPRPEPGSFVVTWTESVGASRQAGRGVPPAEGARRRDRSRKPRRDRTPPPWRS